MDLDLTYDQAKSIISDKTNPHYARYHNNDADIHSAVTRAYLKQYPGEYDLNDKTPAALRGGAAPEKAGDPVDQAGADRLVVAGPEAAAQLAGFLGVTPGGQEFESFRAEANDYIAANFKSYDDFHRNRRGGGIEDRSGGSG